MVPFYEKGKPVVKESTFLENQVGVIAVRPYKKGEVIFLVEGPTTSKRSKHSFEIGLNRHIEPRQVGDTYNLGHCVNHSCDPTVIAKIIEKGNTDPYIEVIARRDLKKGEEMTFDYATLEYEITLVNTICKCKAEKCRGMIHGFKDLPSDVVESYKEEGIFASYLLEVEKDSGKSFPH